ncbi:S1 family peptidase [Spirillospora sp. CA-294931]|uniref:S1 family peptidase n=1 Tax=Spirillospora sp. CA-294931 TaxID=3240042 RepID=UPI003D917871
MRRKLSCALVFSAVAASLAAAPAAIAQPGPLPIIDGSYADEGPWAAMLERDGQQWCSGSIIDDTWVLTAEHCVDDDASYTVRVGEVDHRDGTYAKVTRVYTPSNGADIALLRLDRSVQATYSRLGAQPQEGDTEYVYGWGRDQNGTMQRYLKVAEMTIIDVGGGLIHAKRGDGLTNSGDSGGPVFVDGVQVGVHISGNKKDRSTHTSVASNRTWIRNTSGV